MVSSSVSARFLYGFPYRFQRAWTVLCSMKYPLDVVRVGAWNSLIRHSEYLASLVYCSLCKWAKALLVVFRKQEKKQIKTRTRKGSSIYIVNYPGDHILLEWGRCGQNIRTIDIFTTIISKVYFRTKHINNTSFLEGTLLTFQFGTYPQDSYIG